MFFDDDLLATLANSDPKTVQDFLAALSLLKSTGRDLNLTGQVSLDFSPADGAS